MNAMTHQVAIKWLSQSSQPPLWLIAQHERECCGCAEPAEECEHKSRCSMREQCRAVETAHYAAMHCGKNVPREAMQHVIDGRVAVIRTDSVTWESRQ